MIDFNNENCTCDFLSKMKSAKAIESPWKYYIVDDFFCEFRRFDIDFDHDNPM